MLPLWAIGALAGAAKSELIDRPKQEQQVASRAIEARFAPLMGKAAPSFADIKAPDTAQSAIDWGLTGAAMGQNKAQFDLDKKMYNAQMDNLGKKNELLDKYIANFGGGQEPDLSPQQVQSFQEGAGPLSPQSAAKFQRRIDQNVYDPNAIFTSFNNRGN